MTFFRLSLKFLCLFLALGSLPLLGDQLPNLEKAVEILKSDDFEARDKLTNDLWKNGQGSIPLLAKLMELEDPEIRSRATDIHRRVKHGLKPKDSIELLEAVEAVTECEPADRGNRMEELLALPNSFTYANSIIEAWCQGDFPPAPSVFASAAKVAVHVVDTGDLATHFPKKKRGPKSRALFIHTFLQERPNRSAGLVRILIGEDPETVYRNLLILETALPQDLAENFALAFVKIERPLLAFSVLEKHQEVFDPLDWARSIVWLEHQTQVTSPTLSSEIDPSLSYYRNLISTSPTPIPSSRLPDEISSYQQLLVLKQKNQLADHLPADETLASFLQSLHHHLIDGSLSPDMEALSAMHSPNLRPITRALIMLGGISEAAAKLNEDSQTEIAMRLLWNSGRFEEASAMFERTLQSAPENEAIRLRLTMAELFLSSGEIEKAKNESAFLLTLKLPSSPLRWRALRLLTKFHPLEKVISLIPAEEFDVPPSERLPLRGLLRKYPYKIRELSYRTIEITHPDLGPVEIIRKIETILEKDRKTVGKFLKDAVAKLFQKPLWFSALKEKDLFLKNQNAINILAATSRDRSGPSLLSRAFTDEAYSMKLRKRALKDALKISPYESNAHGWAMKLHPDLAAQKHSARLFLGLDPHNVLLHKNLVPLESLLVAAKIADHSTVIGNRVCIEAASRLAKEERFEEAAHYLEICLLSQVALDHESGLSFKKLFATLNLYYEVRAQLADSDETRELWRAQKISKT